MISLYVNTGIDPTRSGAEALSLGLVAGCQLAGVDMFFGSYPITPASPLLHHLARLKEFGITTFQAEDEIAAICAAIGASYAGQLGITVFAPAVALEARSRAGWDRVDGSAAARSALLVESPPWVSSPSVST